MSDFVWHPAAQHSLEPTAPSALVVSRLFGFVGRLVQCDGCANPALRLSFSVRFGLVEIGGLFYKEVSKSEGG
jgi:hypothetical protein